MQKMKTNNKRIVHLTSVHPPFDVRIFHKECKSLSRYGYDTSLISTGETEKFIDNINVLSVGKTHNRFYRMTLTLWKVYKKSLLTKGSLYHFHDPELIPVGIYLKMRGKKVIYDVHENVPDQILDKYWIPKPLRWILAKGVGFLEWIGSRIFFDGIVAATPKIASRFPKNKTSLVQNFPKLNLYTNQDQLPYSQRQNGIIYVGAITEQRGLKNMINILNLFPPQLNVKLHLAGQFSPQELFTEVEKMKGWKNVKFYGVLPHEKITSLFGDVKIGLSLLHPIKQYIDSLPIKIFEYMAAGLPIIASRFPLWQDIIEKHKCGILVDPLNDQEIAEAIRFLLDHPHEAEEMGMRGQKAAFESYDWVKEEEKLLNLYKKILP